MDLLLLEDGTPMLLEDGTPLLLESTQETPIARWDEPPYRTYAAPVRVGVVAYHMNEIASVAFVLDDVALATVIERRWNPSTLHEEDFWVTLPTDLSDGQHTLDATVTSYDGQTLDLPTLAFATDYGNTLFKQVRYVSRTGNDSTGDGLTLATAYRTTAKAGLALTAAGGGFADGGTIYLGAGDWDDCGFNQLGFGSYTHTDQRRLRVTRAPGVPRESVIISDVYDEYGWNTKLLEVFDVTFRRTGYFAPMTVTVDGPISEAHLYVHDFDAVGAGKDTTDFGGPVASTDWTTKHATEFTLTAATFASLGFDLVRNYTISAIGSDLFNRCGLVINGTSTNEGTPTDPLSHPDTWQANPASNVIFANHTGLMVVGQGLYWANITGGAVVNVIIDNTNGTGTAGDAGCFYPLEGHRHTLVKRSHFIGRALFGAKFGDNTVGEGPATDFFIDDTVFTDTLSSGPGTHAGVTFRTTPVLTLTRSGDTVTVDYTDTVGFDTPSVLIQAADDDGTGHHDGDWTTLATDPASNTVDDAGVTATRYYRAKVVEGSGAVAYSRVTKSTVVGRGRGRNRIGLGLGIGL
jgi:hypothetical protein